MMEEDSFAIPLLHRSLWNYDGGSSDASSASDEEPTATSFSENPSFADRRGLQIGWYCFLAVTVIPLLSCFVSCCVCRYRRRLVRQWRAADAAEESRQQALLRMQANVTKFAAAQDQSEKRNWCTWLAPQTMTIQANDPRLRQASSSFCTDLDEDLEACTNHNSNDNDNLGSPTCLPAREEDNTASACCLICLETWQAGDLLCQSTGCPHAFHQGCIVAWLLVRRSNTRSDCPCCRQDFCSVQTTRGRAAAGTGAPPVVPTTTATTTLTTTATSPHKAFRAPPAEDSVES